MHVVDCIINAAKDGGTIDGDAGHLPVIIEQPNHVILAAAADHGQDFTRQAAGTYQDQFAHVTAPAAACRGVVTGIRSMLYLSGA
ncbi:hypothetical protein NicSoilB11_40550 [Arthrobacter sp. NicSoilB11]|nr:hypothetical protein StoSoilB19_39990 [Arthrobacter sp. StoSoilB19]BCW77730.1 hypothetical protein NicSoilB11_40550 [Arthrobacter sp. NicSoilB11]